MRLVIAGAVTVLLGFGQLRPAMTQIAVVVNRANPVSNFTLEELRRLYLGTTTRLGRGLAVALIEYPPARQAFYRRVLAMSETSVKRHWIAVVFAGEGAEPPREIADPAELLQYVAAHPGAVAFVNHELVDTSVKVVTVNGLRPTEAGYPLGGRAAPERSP